MNLLVFLIGLNAVILWFSFWQRFRAQARPSAALVAVEIAGYIVVAGLVVRVVFGGVG